jgi:hypothetical protein
MGKSGLSRSGAGYVTGDHIQRQERSRWGQERRLNRKTLVQTDKSTEREINLHIQLCILQIVYRSINYTSQGVREFPVTIYNGKNEAVAYMEKGRPAGKIPMPV